MAELTNVRRYYLQKRRKARELVDTALEVVWHAKQEEESGTALGSTFPHRSALAALGYTTTEDLEGADEAELFIAGLTRHQAQDVIGAL